MESAALTIGGLEVRAGLTRTGYFFSCPKLIVILKEERPELCSGSIAYPLSLAL